MDNPTGSVSVLDKYKPLFLQFIRFVIIGIINTGVDFAILNFLSYLTGVKSGKGVIILNVISFTVAVTNSYFLNKYWTFKDSGRVDEAKKFTLFLIVSIIGLLINTGIVFFITTYVPSMFGLSASLWLNLAKLMATGLSLIWNFIGYKLIVFKR